MLYHAYVRSFADSNGDGNGLLDIGAETDARVLVRRMPAIGQDAYPISGGYG